ncbi:MAG: NfeD family protein [Alistipes sp.]
MWFIGLLIFFGLIFLVAEIVLLPGLSIGGILSLSCYGCAGYLAFRDFGSTAGTIIIVIILLLSVAAVAVSLRSKTWQRFSLHQKVGEAMMPTPEQDDVKIGDRGTTLSRLSPMGTVEIRGKIYEAKHISGYVDPQTEVEVVGFTNSNVIVKTMKH